MAKQLVIVVHGVGVKEAGVSADLLATALDETPEENANLTREGLRGSRLRPHSSDDFHLREMAQYNKGGLRQLFPARIRRYRHNDDNNGQLLEERVVADFYWGDISNIASGLPGLLLGTWKTILGLSHIIRENALSVFSQNDWHDWFMRRTAALAALTIHGPIAAINIVLLLGVLLNFAFGKAGYENVPGAIWATIIASAVIGLYLSRQSPVFLTRMVGGWMSAVAIVFLGIWLFLPEGGAGLAAFGGISDEAIVKQACIVKESEEACKGAATGIFMQGLRLIAIMGYLFVIVIVCAVVLSIAELVRYLKNKTVTPPSIVAPTISLMMLLWIVMIGTIWAVIHKTPGELIPSAIPLEGILGALIYCIAGLTAIAVGAMFAFIRTRRWAKNFDPKNYIDPANGVVAHTLADKNRMITSSFILWPLRGFLFVLAVFSLVSVAQFYDLPFPGIEMASSWTKIDEVSFANIILGLTAVGGFAVAAGQAPLRAGLGIAIDVITWLNDHSWDSTECKRTETCTVFERTLPALYASKSNLKAEGYWRRDRIKSRLDVLATQLIRDERPDRLFIVSHSQGTVVAIDVLNTEGARWLSMMPEGGKIFLATMGSPYTHVHNRYFPSAFAPVDELKNLAPVKGDGILTDWINIFRIDDFVGTHIDPTGKWPREFAVPPNGHTLYWIDDNVFAELKKFVEPTSQI
ncbi:MAG: hypothetical protein ACRCU5_06570 [Rhizobiaceae bacterium]